jgi:hypothetical protein
MLHYHLKVVLLEVLVYNIKYSVNGHKYRAVGGTNFRFHLISYSDGNAFLACIREVQILMYYQISPTS